MEMIEMFSRDDLRRKMIATAAILTLPWLVISPAVAIDDSVLTEVEAFGFITDAQLKQFKARREVVVVTIKDGRAAPSEIKATRNTVVVFENQDEDEPHFLYFTPDPNNDLKARVLTGLIKPGTRWAASFTSGEYPFHCARHAHAEEERGRIVVD
jgi:plastocyanin